VSERTLDIVTGRIPVLECLRAGTRPARKLFVLRGARDLGVIRDAAGTLPVEEVSRADLDHIAQGGPHQGVILRADPLPLHGIKEWLARIDRPDAVAVVLDGIEDPHNFGAIVRSASACGAVGAIFGKDRAAPISAAALKSAAGAMEHLALVRVTNITQGLESLKKAGFWIAALEADADQLLWDADLTGRIALVIGSEGKGIRRLVYEHCDFRLRVPMTGPIGSVNASVCAGIALAECLRQRHAGKARVPASRNRDNIPLNPPSKGES